MSRHRNLRGKNFADENEDYEEVYGHSYDDNDYSISPETSSQFLYDRSKNETPNAHIQSNYPVVDINSENLPTDINKAKLYSCLENIQDIIGESISEDIIIAQILKNNYDNEKTLSSLLSNNRHTKPYVCNTTPPATTKLIKKREDVLDNRLIDIKSGIIPTSNIVPKQNDKVNTTLSRHERFQKLFPTQNLPALTKFNSPAPNTITAIKGLPFVLKTPIKLPTFSLKLPPFVPKTQEINSPKWEPESLAGTLSLEPEQAPDDNGEVIAPRPVNYRVLDCMRIHDFNKETVDKIHKNVKHTIKCRGEQRPSMFCDLLSTHYYEPNGFGVPSQDSIISIYDRLDDILSVNSMYSYSDPSLNIQTPLQGSSHTTSTSSKISSRGHQGDIVPGMTQGMGTLTIDKGIKGKRDDKGGDHVTSSQLSPSALVKPNAAIPAPNAGPKSTPSTSITLVKPPAADKFDVEKEYNVRRKDTGDNVLNVIVIGHVDAGKSTLMGHLLYLSGHVLKKAMHKNEVESKKVGKGSFAYAWVLDETNEERSRGITMDVAHRRLKLKDKVINLIDAPGHKDFIPNMINGTSQAEAAILVVDSTKGEFETGFESGGQTREHALLARSLGISQMVVAVNKMDNVDWDRDRFDAIVDKLSLFLKQIGFREKNLSFVPCSGLLGENVASVPHNEKLQGWWPVSEASTLLGKIGAFQMPERAILKPYRFVISDVYKSPVGSGICLAGKMEAGVMRVGNKGLILPPNETATVKTIRLDETDEGIAFAGDNAVVIVTGCDLSNLSSSASGGLVLCPPQNPIPMVHCVQARILVFSNLPVPITLGFNAVFHYQTANEPCVLTKLLNVLNKASGEVIKARPRVLAKNCSATVEITFQRPICLELYADSKELGRFTLRQASTSVCAGIVTKIVR